MWYVKMQACLFLLFILLFITNTLRSNIVTNWRNWICEERQEYEHVRQLTRSLTIIYDTRRIVGYIGIYSCIFKEKRRRNLTYTHIHYYILAFRCYLTRRNKNKKKIGKNNSCHVLLYIWYLLVSIVHVCSAQSRINIKFFKIL